MRLLLLFTMLLSPLAWGFTTYPDDGLYRCFLGNNTNICDQQIKVIFVRGKLDSVRVMYEGYCNGQGPYTYECDRDQCTDGTILFRFENETSYYWENLGHGFHCRMEKIF